MARKKEAAWQKSTKWSQNAHKLQRITCQHTETMPPNANISRRSNGLASKATVSTQDLDNDPALQSVRTMKSLKGTEIAIDGVIYDISDFVHPGGEVVKFFGGNDVTVQYRMIHPYHTGKHLEKMKEVGKVVDYEAE